MKLSILFLATLLSFNSLAADYQTEIDDFFKLYQSGKVDEAVDSIYRTNKYVSSIPDQIKNVKNQLNALEGLIGDINNIGKVDTYAVGDNFVHVTYLATYDRQPVRYEFQFFKVKSGWRIYSFSFDDGITQEIATEARKAALSSQK
ncbi:hypothetical protein LMJ53_09315 [Rheinheimera sp. UJ51]|uniref:hypothetical protein n=1 Tax=unclassified Rheinheimera TaxID=115860 RepID=UPI001E511114|nr:MULTISPECIES: hypothetical protein [unclassified Rheinheimera]MCC5451920.1 hypothetical protein [Rheinheimera sp. UJ51]MCF4009946.1 hypothetical protein [Rheinheimera sp. UJ63]